MSKDKGNKSVNKKTILRILKYIKRYRFLVVLSLICAAISVVLTLYAPIIMGHAVDRVVGPGKVDFTGLKGMLAKLVIVVVITAVAQWVMNVLNNMITYRVVNDVRTKAYEKLGRKPKREAEARTKQILEQFYQKTQGEITRSFLSRMITRLESEQSVKEYLDIMDHRKTEQLIDTLDKDAFSSNADEPTLAKLFGKVTSSRFVPLNAIVPIFFKPSGRTTLVKFVHW